MIDQAHSKIPPHIKAGMRRGKFIQHMNHSIERGFIEAKRLEGWTEKKIAKAIENLEHLRAAHEALREEYAKQMAEKENDTEAKGVE